MQDVRDVDHTFMIKPFKYDSSNPDCEPEPVHEIDTYRDVWQNDYVRVPCSAGNITSDGTSKWCVIQIALMKLKEKCEANTGTVNTIKDGSVMDEGCVQEEIRFTISTEMLVSLLVCEKMQSNECIFLIGCEQFSTYTGYANTFKAIMQIILIKHRSKNSWGRKLCHVVAMDAIYYANPLTQYTVENMARELIKAHLMEIEK
ncbi:unnamed protein product [Adineta steineri]|uniref:PARG catalytic Macro domain-containing protein n=1 Tax=Adineta steineri TaxID=433720 RepID=A0A813PB91_9BILA|nr:unnamed protein product [Adineta steineri]CAF0747862.1 unnamed protein product [Adineta steineri]